MQVPLPVICGEWRAGRGQPEGGRARLEGGVRKILFLNGVHKLKKN
jgi:hypothetical protein